MWRIGYGEGYYGKAKYGVPSVTYVPIAAASSLAVTSAGSARLVRDASAVAGCVFSAAIAATLVREIAAPSAWGVSTAITGSTVIKPIAADPSLIVVASAANVNLVLPLSAGSGIDVGATANALRVRGISASTDIVTAADCWGSLVAAVAGAANQNVDSYAAAFYTLEPVISSACSVSAAITYSDVTKPIGATTSLLVTSAAGINLVQPLSAGSGIDVGAAADVLLVHGAAASLDLGAATDCWVSLVASVDGGSYQNVDSYAAAFYKWEPLIAANYPWLPAETHDPPAWASLPADAASWTAVDAPDPQTWVLVPTAPSVWLRLDTA